MSKRLKKTGKKAGHSNASLLVVRKPNSKFVRNGSVK